MRVDSFPIGPGKAPRLLLRRLPVRIRVQKMLRAVAEGRLAPGGKVKVRRRERDGTALQVQEQARQRSGALLALYIKMGRIGFLRWLLHVAEEQHTLRLLLIQALNQGQ